MFRQYTSAIINEAQSLYTRCGHRKYLNEAERQRFLVAATKQPLLTHLLCHTMFYTGCRISEALNLTTGSVLELEGVLLIRSLKKRDHTLIRQVPLPTGLISELINLNGSLSDSALIWKWGRTWAWSQIKNTMAFAEIVGPQATPRGLRHSFGVHAIQRGVPLNLVQRWLGHADIKTTAIYTNAVGQEERSIAERMW